MTGGTCRHRVLFLGQHVTLPEGAVPPHGSGAHAAATVSGLRDHFEVRTVVAEADAETAGDSVRSGWSRFVPARIRGARRDLRTLREDRSFARRALDEAHQFLPDVVYERNEYLSTAGLRISRSLGIPLVLEVNGIQDRDVRSMYRSLAEPLGAALERRKLRRADAIVTVTPGLADRLEKAGARRGKIAIAPNSVDPALVSPTARALRPDSAVVGWIGHLMQWHVDALELLIDAAPAVIAGVPHARFVIVGGGPGLGELRARVAAQGLADRFEFTGPVEHDRVPAAMANVDVGVIPAVFDYAFPVKLVEMGALGVPVVAPRSDSLDLLIAPGAEYEPFDPGVQSSLVEALVKLLSDPERRDRLGDGLRRATEDRYTWPVVGEITARAIEGTLPSRSD